MSLRTHNLYDDGEKDMKKKAGYIIVALGIIIVLISGIKGYKIFEMIWDETCTWEVYAGALAGFIVSMDFVGLIIALIGIYSLKDCS